MSACVSVGTISDGVQVVVPGHFFVASETSWYRHSNLYCALRYLSNFHDVWVGSQCNMYFVPGINFDYEVEAGKPKAKGAQLIGAFQFTDEDWEWMQ